MSRDDARCELHPPRVPRASQGAAARTRAAPCGCHRVSAAALPTGVPAC